MPGSPEYKMDIGLVALRHLGIGLYGSEAAAVSEAVANAWDADASRVSISTGGGRIVIEDDGCGMAVADANEKYLRVGYERRGVEGGRTPGGRRVMGRRGIGSLSLFSAADIATVHSVRGGERHGFAMRVRDMEESAKRGEPYRPEPIGAAPGLEAGTRITLSGLRRAARGAALRRQLARRFSVIGEANGFEVAVDGDGIGEGDRGYESLQYVWNFGGSRRHGAGTGRGAPQEFSEDVAVRLGGGDAPLDGWIGTARRPGDLRDDLTGESLNRIAVVVRGRTVQDDILGELAGGGAPRGCIVGEVDADFLDADDEDDIVTTGRQGIREDAPRYEALRDAVQRALGAVELKWNELRGVDGARRAREIPEINRWYRALGQGHKGMARSLFGSLNRLPVDDDGDRRMMLVGGALAFEGLDLRDVLDGLGRAGAGGARDVDALRDALLRLDDFEASAYYQTVKGRLVAAGAIAGMVDDSGGGGLDVKVLEMLFDRPWLLDPSWERAAGAEYMEAVIKKAIDAEAGDKKGPEGRPGIRYRTAAGKHIIIVPMRQGAKIRTGDLITLLSKYDVAVRRALGRVGRDGEPTEFVCVVGDDLVDWYDPRSRGESERALTAYSARVVKYGELIRGAREAYREYAESGKSVTRVHDLVMSIGEGDRRLMKPFA